MCNLPNEVTTIRWFLQLFEMPASQTACEVTDLRIFDQSSRPPLQDGTALRYAGEFMRQDRQFLHEALSSMLGILSLEDRFLEHGKSMVGCANSVSSGGFPATDT